MPLPRIVVVGGHGKVALHFARLASSSFSITSLVRSESHFDDIRQTGASPKLLSLEDASVAELQQAFSGAQGVLFTAGAGGKGGKERTVKVDQEGAIKVFDAIEGIEGEEKPKLILIGALDTRDLSQPPPEHYNEADIAESKKAHDAIGAYYDAKLAAARNLHKRTSFPWIELRPGHLKDDKGTGKVSLGVTHMGSVTREDVAAVLVSLFKQPRDAAKGLSLDLINGETEIEEAVKQAVEKNESSFSG
ncbi:uncharacterized protein JCM6883_003949 [Sporobolomyces salmoneus]|uniref:uncharacterized protein n=1 Tax=Sporobolomyces salmoneus TaxID=183962 RepID=UPI003173FE2E